MSEFKKEERYIVFKIKDIHNYLVPDERANLERLAGIINISRNLDKRPFMECVVVEHDWLIYDDVWNLVQAEWEMKEALKLGKENE
jgi:hypothetical protein